jgi:hypothetical protein
MFIAKFTQTSGSPFTADKNGNLPFIGTVASGLAKGTLINGTIFQREGLEANQLYLCDNSVDPEYPTNVRVDIISKVSVTEFMALRTQLGAGKTVIGAADDAVTVDAVTVEEEIPTV